jgi:hypothetical protein
MGQNGIPRLILTNRCEILYYFSSTRGQSTSSCNQIIWSKIWLDEGRYVNCSVIENNKIIIRIINFKKYCQHFSK